MIEEVDKYIDDVVDYQAPETEERKTNTLYHFVIWAEENDYTKPNREVVREFVKYMSDRGYPDSTISLRFFTITGFANSRYNIDFNRYDEDKYDKNPILEKYNIELDKAERDKNQSNKESWLTVEEYEKLLDATKSLKEEVLIRFLWNTGARATEAAKTDCSNVDIEDREVQLPTIKNDDIEWRTVFLNRITAHKLDKWKNRGGRERYDPGKKNDALFVSYQSDRLSRNRINSIVKERAWDAGIQKVLFEDMAGNNQHRVTAHTIRYSYCVHRIKYNQDESGNLYGAMSTVVLKRLMGHKSIETTESYARKHRTEDRRQADKRCRPR